MKSIIIEWDTSDVQEVRPDLSEDQAYQVLLTAKKEHDATTGINWDVLEGWANFLFPETATC